MFWTTFKLSSRLIAAGEGMRAQEMFEKWFMGLTGPPDMAMFSITPPGDDHQRFYLSPGTQVRAPALVRLLNAEPTEPPPDDATLLVGRTGAKPSNL